jgi:hypothetical protein
MTLLADDLELLRHPVDEQRQRLAREARVRRGGSMVGSLADCCARAASGHAAAAPPSVAKNFRRGM